MRISDWSSDVCSSDLLLLQTLDLGVALDPIIELPDHGSRNCIGGAVERRAHSRWHDEQVDAVSSQIAQCCWANEREIEIRTGLDAVKTQCIGKAVAPVRSEESRVGEECVSTCRSGWSRYN